MFVFALICFVFTPISGAATRSFDLTSLGGRNNRLQAADLNRFFDFLQGRSCYISFSAQQKKGTSGTLFHVSSRHELLFSLHSEQNPEIVGKTGLLAIKYKSVNGKRVIRIPFNLTDTEHEFVFWMVDGKLGLTADCNILVDGQTSPIMLPPVDQLKNHTKFFVGQKTRHQNYFLGNISNFQLSKQRNTSKCIHHRSTRRIKPAMDRNPDDCPGCMDYLRHRINQLDNRVLQLEKQSENHQNHLSRMQRHQRGCFEKGRLYNDGDQWELANCTTCTCIEGYPVCHPKGCPKLNCEKPVKKPGSCCPACMESCTYNGKSYQHGETSYPKKCYEVRCDNGDVSVRVVKRNCPSLPCPEHETQSGECCPRCKKGFDYCGHGHACGKNAECSNEDYKPVCRCKAGYVGDPDTECVDFDECGIDADIAEQIGCGYGAVCVNTPGSFKCHCRPGFVKLNEKECFDVLQY